MEFKRDINVSRLKGLKLMSEPFVESSKLNLMLRRFSDLVEKTASDVYGPSHKLSFSIHTAGWECKLHFVITKRTPLSQRPAEPRIGEMFGQNGLLWEPMKKLASQFGFVHIEGRDFVDLDTLHLLRAST